MSNIDKFDEYVGRIFVLLYEHFPAPIELSFKDVMGLDDLEHHSHDVIIANDEYEPYGTTRDDVFIAMSTIKWLNTTGYIRVQNLCTDSATGVFLTEKTLSILKSVPASLQKPEESLGVKIKNTMKSAPKEAMKTIGNEVLKYGVKYFIIDN